MSTEQQPRLGIDIGRVIIEGSDHRQDTSFFGDDEQAMLATPEIDGAFETIARLVKRFDGQVWLVSKCGPVVQGKTRRWLQAHDFWGRTGVDPERLVFCLTRADKRQHCLDLALTHFVDDHPEVHEHIRDVVAHQYFFGPQEEQPGYGTVTPTWADVEREITAT